jgi:hypothetical protein
MRRYCTLRDSVVYLDLPGLCGLGSQTGGRPRGRQPGGCGQI